MTSESPFQEFAHRYGVQLMPMHHWMALSKAEAGEYVFEVVQKHPSSNGIENGRLKAIEAKAEALFLYQQWSLTDGSRTELQGRFDSSQSSEGRQSQISRQPKCVTYTEYESNNLRLSSPVSSLEEFVSYIKSETHMINPKLYVYSFPNNPLSRLKIQTDAHFQQLILHPEHPEPLYIYEGADLGRSPPKDRNGLPLIIRTQFTQSASSILPTATSANVSPLSNNSPKGSASSPKYAQERMATLVADRDSYSCVVTNVSKIGDGQLATFNACHILAAAESRRTISSEYLQEMQRAQPDDYNKYKSWWVPSTQGQYVVQIPYSDTYDPRLALFLQASFNGLLDRGEAWFITDPETQKVRVKFEETKGDFEKYDGAEIRRPDEGKTSEERTSAEIVKKLALWPDQIVFDLHRVVLAPYYRWQRRQRDREESSKKRKPEN